jgi:putative transposase
VARRRETARIVQPATSGLAPLDVSRATSKKRLPALACICLHARLLQSHLALARGQAEKLVTRIRRAIAASQISAKSKQMARGQSSRQLGFQFRTRGGARPGAGRPARGAKAGVSHLRRPAHSRHHPLHVTLRLLPGVPSLRTWTLFERVRAALAAARERFGFRLVHFSVQSNHLHLIAEADDARALSRGVQGLTVRVARALNRRLQRKGRLFADRYHVRALKTPRSVRLALRYVLLNAHKHTRLHSARGQQVSVRCEAVRCEAVCSEAVRATTVPAGFIDSRSSAPWFHGFARPRALTFGATAARSEWARARGNEGAPVTAPRSWLLRIGYQRAGPFDVDEAPGLH